MESDSAKGGLYLYWCGTGVSIAMSQIQMIKFIMKLTYSRRVSRSVSIQI